MKKLLRQIIRFAVTGGSAFVIDYGLMLFLTEKMKMAYMLSNIFSFSISVIYNYVLSTKWVFDVKNQRSSAMEFSVFLFLSIIGLGINEIILITAVEILGMHYTVGKIVAAGIVMIYNFVSRKMILE